MRKIFAIVCFLLMYGAAFGQLSQFRMIGSGSWSTVNDSTFSSTVTIQADLTSNGFLPTGITDSMLIFSQTGQRYTISSAINLTFSSADLTIVESGGDWGTPVGQVMIYEDNSRDAVPNIPFGATGATAKMQEAVDSYNSTFVIRNIVGRQELIDSTTNIRADFPVPSTVDSTRLIQDSILVYYQGGSEIGRDTIQLASAAGVSRAELQDSTAAVRADFPSGGGSSNIDSLHLGTITNQTDTIIFFGNSITNNLAVGDADKRWPNIVAANHDAFAHNEGISGSRMQDSPASANAMINRIGEIPSKRSTHLAIVFLYGANDMQTGTGSDTQFQTDYQEVIDSCIARGWSSSEIIVLTPTPLTTGGGAPQSEQDDYNTATNALTNCTIVDVYTPLSSIGVDNFTSDGTHPEELGSSVIASYVSEAIDMTIKSKGQGVAINGTTELDTVLLRNLEYASDTLTEILMLEKDGTVKKRNKYDENWVYSHTNIDVANDISVNGFTIGRGNPTATTTAFFGTNKALTTASQSTIFGVDAGEALTTGNANTFFGWQAGSFTTTQVGSTFFGARAGERSTANSNSFFGYNAGLLVTTGASNNALGANALSKTTTGSFNVAIGRAAVANTTGSNNIAIGEVSLFSAQTLSNITAIGVFALQNYTTGSNTAAIGHSALVALEEANDTYAMGASVGNNVKNTDRSVLLGTRAGSYANFNNVVAIGYESGNRNPTTNSSVTVLDASTDVDISTERVTITGHGKSWSGWVHCKVVGADVPGGLISGSFYAVQVIDANTLEFDRNLTSTGSGTFTIADQVSIENSISIGSNSEVDGEDQIALGDGSHTELRAGKFEWNIDQDTSGKDGYVMTFNSSTGQMELVSSSGGSVTASDVSVTDSATKFDSTTVEGVLEELATPSYAQIAQTVTFNGNTNDRIDTLSIDDTWNILSRPENFAVIDTTSGDWNADSLAVGKLVYLGSKTKKFRVSVSFSGEMNGTGDASWVGAYKNAAIENHSVKKIFFENVSPRDYHFSFIVELATNDTLDVRFRDETSSVETVYLYSCNISLNQL